MATAKKKTTKKTTKKKATPAQKQPEVVAEVVTRAPFHQEATPRFR